jgi:hypothetical protein
MIQLQIVEQHGAKLYRELRSAMRSKSLRTFYTKNRGATVLHSNPSYAGRMRWAHVDGVITGTIVSPRKPGTEWQFLSAFVGRLADRYADRIHGISIQFVPEQPKKPARARGKTRPRKSRR